MSPTTCFSTDFETAVSPDRTAPLRVIITHDDHAACVRALRMLHNTFFELPDADSLRPLPWKFDELTSDSLRKLALADVPRTDVFVVSSSQGGELPETVARWLHDCFALRQNLPTAVIAVSESLNDMEVPWRRLLREATEAAGFDFLEANAGA